MPTADDVRARRLATERLLRIYHGPDHATTLLKPPFGIDPYQSHKDGAVEIDVDIAPLIVACWALGLETTACCQGRRNIQRWSQRKHQSAYILFRNPPSGRDPAASLRHATMFIRAADQVGAGPNRRQWRFSFTPYPPYGHSVYFPPACIEPITARLERLALTDGARLTALTNQIGS